MVMPFGPHKGQQLADLLTSYIKWLCERIEGGFTKYNSSTVQTAFPYLIRKAVVAIKVPRNKTMERRPRRVQGGKRTTKTSLLEKMFGSYWGYQESSQRDEG